MDLGSILLFAAALGIAIATPGPTIATLVARVLTMGRRATSGLRSASSSAT
jgi:threonine/homoserine/homoserine lactone efflux protein